jgi:RNA polymerase sigma-70 factor (ECF subfamily)
MQAAYIKAYENLNRFKFQSSFATWLTKILVNESLMYLKKRDQMVKRINGVFSLQLDHKAIDIQTPLIKVLNSELKTILETSIRELPEKYRTVFIMREMEKMNVSETMECLELSEANVKVRLNRAKVMLRDKLRAYLKDDEILQIYKTHCDRIVNTVMKKIIEEQT